MMVQEPKITQRQPVFPTIETDLLEKLETTAETLAAPKSPYDRWLRRMSKDEKS